MDEIVLEIPHDLRQRSGRDAGEAIGTAVGGTRHTPNRRKILAGTLAELLLPGLRRELDDASRSTPATGLKLRLKRAMVYARIWRAERRNDPAALERALAVYCQILTAAAANRP